MEPTLSKKKIVITGVILLTLIIGWGLYSAIPRGYLRFRTAPAQVSVIIDNQQAQTINNNTVLTVSPGKHTVEVFRDEFAPYIKDVNVNNGETVKVLAALVALTENAKRLLNNESSNSVIEEATGSRINDEAALLEKSNPILSVLPIETRNYAVFGCPSEKYPDDPAKLALCIYIPDNSFKAAVVKDLKAMGYKDADSYEYIWTLN